MATASRVLSGNTRWPRDIQKVVLDEARKLGIDPAQRNKTKALAFLLSNRAILHAFHSRIVERCGGTLCCERRWCFSRIPIRLTFHGRSCASRGYCCRVHDVIRAVILAGTNSPNLIKLLVHKGISFVVLGNNVVGEQQNLENNYLVVFSE